MSIDDCPYSFEELATTVLPEYMARLHDAIKTPWPVAAFSRSGSGPVAIARELKLECDFGGAYVFVARGVPLYVGISRKVLARVRQHVVTDSHFSASLAYKMASGASDATGRRAVRMDDPAFRSDFRKRQTFLQQQSVAAVAIPNPLELHLFEVYAAMTLNTSRWNTFRTH